MRKRALIAAAAIIFATAATAPAETPAPEQPTATITRIGKKVYTPRRHIRLVRKFTPTATPSPSYAYNVIAPIEAARWGASLAHLRSRIGCETGGTWRYYAHNPSGAAGFAQFLPSTWARALRVWDRRITIRSSSSDLVRRKVVLLYSDGSRKVVRGHLVRRRVSIVRRGLLPRWPSAYHGWANIRAAARALGGYGAVGAGEWSCG